MLDGPVNEGLGGMAPQEFPVAGVAGSSAAVGLGAGELLRRRARGPVGLSAVCALRELEASVGVGHGYPFVGRPGKPTAVRASISTTILHATTT